MRSIRYLGRLLWQSFGYARSERKVMLLVVLVLAPILVLLAFLIGASSPFLVYPFV